MTFTHNGPRTETRYLSVPGGTIAYDIQGEGPLVLLVPGMGDLRAAYRFLVPALVNAGYTAASVDVRGHGESDAAFDSSGDVETAADITLLLEVLATPAVIVGNSMGAGSAVIVAAEYPHLVDGLVLVGPFVRQPASSTAFTRAMLRPLMARPWAAAVWKTYLPKLYAGRRPEDFTDYRNAVIAALRRPGYTRAFSLTARADHRRAGESLTDVTSPTLVVMGEKDPDFADPKGEADWIGRALGGTTVMIADAGHYPQSQQPELTSAAIVRFLGTLRYRAQG
ncbi:pimeloyl-ACP methyl ester carboxylesterase [Marisediminicola sp. UYEF4]|uniref:alpha/beta fold hydrolase n=1 Tax=Marisediminicola sp. UYEF4 TaxID=1756384 RepID=UPI0033947B8F